MQTNKGLYTWTYLLPCAKFAYTQHLHTYANLSMCTLLLPYAKFARMQKLENVSARKTQSLSVQFSRRQCISEPTHFTELKSSHIDILLLTTPNQLILSGVGDPISQQDVRYHCPIYGIFNFSKPKQKSYIRHIWKYEQGDYVTLKHLANTFDWTSLKHEDINI